VLQPPSPQCGQQATGEGQALPSAPHFMEPDQLWVSRSILGYSIRVQEVRHGDSAPGVQEDRVCCSPPPTVWAAKPLVRGRPCHLLHTLWNQASYGSAEASWGIVSGCKREYRRTQPLVCRMTGCAAAPIPTVWAASHW